MKVHVISPGFGNEVDLRDGSTVADLLAAIGHDADDDDVTVYLNSEATYWQHPLKDCDKVGVFRPLRGAAPLPPGMRPHGIQLLRDFSSGAQELIVVDPYATHNGRHNSSSYAAEFVDCLNLESGSVRMLRLIDSSRYHDPIVLQLIIDACRDRACVVVHKHTSSVHDRFWIKDRSEVLALGTSFNSLGGKLAFALNMPATDRDFLLDFLQRNRLI